MTDTEASAANPGLIGLHVEYRVREIKRYIVTRHDFTIHEDGSKSSGRSAQIGSHYDNFETAYAVSYALCRKEHADLGYGLDDMRIQYPVGVPPGTEMTLCPSFHSQEEIDQVGSVFANSEGDIESRA